MRLSRPVLTIAFALLGTAAAFGNDAKDEIRIGQTLPYSGPASGFGIIGRAQEAYFDKVNAEGGINGRKIRFISLDDAYSPPKTVEQTRKLVEQEEVLGRLQAPLGPVLQVAPLAVLAPHARVDERAVRAQALRLGEVQVDVVVLADATVAVERGQGWLEVKRTTPMPIGAYFVAKLAMAMIFSAIIVLLLMAVGTTWGGVRLEFVEVVVAHFAHDVRICSSAAPDDLT